jgi:hypothetical protein
MIKRLIYQCSDFNHELWHRETIVVVMQRNQIVKQKRTS